ncbi:ribbon-helix-helix domain-containing protein [Clostridium tagluense]|uniref:ribbon-helix-helix domain-containing protein n=1 Tax=Clostridium tagluense TaxID=360422 RepID=UPI001C0D4B5C|nr:ribbon-helix-helix domain-containing protein [Clostridium tagluense]MBU3126721.1 ribbon-helix-helix domain-containing protein [Clostridium tagluense]
MDKKSNDDLTTRQRYTASFDKVLLKELKQLSKDTSIPLSKLLDKSIVLLQKEYSKGNQE